MEKVYASWLHGKLSGSIYHKSGSHGCINIPNDAMGKIFNQVEERIKVLVKNIEKQFQYFFF